MWNQLKILISTNLTNKHWVLIGLVGVFLTSLFYNVMLHPILQKRENFQQQEHEILTELQVLRQYQLYQTQLESQSHAMAPQIQFMEQIFPVNLEIGKVTAHLLEAIEASQLQLNRQTIAPETHLEHYVELGIQLEMEGYYDQIESLIHRLELLPFLVNVQKLEIKNQALMSQAPPLKIQLALSIYRRRPT